MPIHLSGLPFDKSIIAELESKLVQDGFEVGNFAFCKQRRAKPYSASYALGVEYEYTVSIFGKSFSIEFSDDEQFSHFFYGLCCPEEVGKHPSGIKLVDLVIQRVERCVEVTKHWLTEDPFKPREPESAQ